MNQNETINQILDKSQNKPTTSDETEYMKRVKRRKNLDILRANIPEFEPELGLTRDEFFHIVNYASALAEASINSCTVDKSLAINSLVSGAIEKSLGTEWELVEISDERRLEYQGRFRVGQVDIQNKTCLLGYWAIQSTLEGSRNQQVFFEITAEVMEKPEIKPILLKNKQKQNEMKKQCLAIGKESWKHSVDADSKLGKWLIQLSGTETIGWIKGYDNIGFITKAIACACEPHGLSHLLLPMQRRDHGDSNAPLLFGDFVKMKENTFQWSGEGMFEDELVQVTVNGQLQVEIVVHS